MYKNSFILLWFYTKILEFFTYFPEEIYLFE